ncbi:hypothetical protein Y032_0138g2050 [Ancylostoma ceylanicum]|uniref:GIY-YIG domain-containing protein n=1 Tax=Ancylostoma ceylanicum TaxID=53326 RepID=A0A016T508_9BILA|nr:hypothetical protein Y032_0138g2050 [Ancylostoma ceylanicum]
MLNIVIKERRRSLYATLLKCVAKEQACRRLLPDQTWRRIEGGSKSICDSIRSKVKSALLAKYNRLSSALRENHSRDESNQLAINRSDQSLAQNENTTARVTIIGNTQLSTNAINFLSLGPSFSPAQNINPLTYRKVVGGLHRLRDSLRSKTKRDNLQSFSTLDNRRILPAVPFPRSFYKEPEPVREVEIKFRILGSGVLEVLNKFKHHHYTNLSRDQLQGFKELRELISNSSIRLSVSDKGGEFVVMPQELDRRITSAHLADTTTYRPATEKEFQTQCRRLNDIWTKVGKSAGLDDRFISRLRLENPSCPVFYSLINTHKTPLHEMGSMSADTFKIRPIISCVGGPTDRISWFLNKIVSPLIRKVPRHLSNTCEFIDQLRNAHFEQNSVIESFDVTSLYTNVQDSDALQALSEMLDKYAGTINTYGLSKARIMTLINKCLKCNTFKWSGTYFSQMRGLAMGQRLAPVLAIRFMSKVEEPVLARMPQMYCRYIDDCCIITSTQSEMDECFRILNQQSQYIKFTRETPEDGWLPYLNAKVKLSNGILKMKWYRKESSKNILINARSAHPTAIKRAVIRNMFRTAAMVCTGDHERSESRKMASQIASSNGYFVSQHSRKHHIVNRNHNQSENKLPLCLPFISDEVSAAIQKCIFRAELQNDVVLVSIPNDNIKKQLVRNRLYDRQCVSEHCIVCPHGKEGDCAKVGVIYQIECLDCHALYIGETGRALNVRVKEHLASKRRSSLISPLGRHRNVAHCGNDFDVKCTILTCEAEISARKALEAFWITVKNPEMNNKNECLSITSDFLPFVSLCEL